MSTVLSHEEASRAYDRIGSLQDTQAFYEDPAVRRLVEHGEFGAARHVFELGCGTGRLAHRLLDEQLPADAHYRGIDVSPKMVSLAMARLAPFATRVEVVLGEGGPPVDEPSGAYDRFVSTYVLDLLSEDDIRAMLREAHRMLRPGGRLCLAGLTTGVGPVSRTISRAWRWLQARRPALVGGCRPVDVLPFVKASDWTILHHEKVVSFGVASEVLVARREPAPSQRGASPD